MMNLDDLSPELKEKALSCKTPEELLALAKEQGYEMSDEELKSIAGGWDSNPCSTYERCDLTTDWC